MVVARIVTNSVPESEIVCDVVIIDKKGTETIFLLYRGNCHKDYAGALHKISVPCTIIMTLRSKTQDSTAFTKATSGEDA